NRPDPVAYPHIVIRPYPRYVADSQDPYQFHYLTEIETMGPGPAQLLHRRWLITDATGKMLEAGGRGVVVERPVMAEGEGFRYQRGVPLVSPFGVMEGGYTVQDEPGQPFEPPIAASALAVANVIDCGVMATCFVGDTQGCYRDLR